MRRTAVGVAVVALGLSTAACGGSDEPAASATSESPAEAPSPSSSSGSPSSSSGGAPASGTTVLTGTVGRWDARGARVTAVLSQEPLTVLYDGRATAAADASLPGDAGYSLSRLWGSVNLAGALRVVAKFQRRARVWTLWA